MRTPLHRGFYSRGYQTHFDAPYTVQSVNFRLFGNLPPWCMKSPTGESVASNLRRNVEDYLDSVQSDVLTQDDAIGEIVENALLHFQGQRYFLLAWVVMPNHVHVCFEQKSGYPLAKVLHSWKRFTASAINDHLGREGHLWQRDYFDKAVRSERRLIRVINYIHGNPVKARLVRSPSEWRWSSAWGDRYLDLHSQWRREA